MDDLYGNLENYDEVNALEELRTENKELKVKLDDYAATMDKLQKDFDKLASEFKSLEFNYSSLLKTARAEIERKTQMIAKINIEKDMLVLNSLQNGNRNILRRNMTNKPLPVKKDWKENEPDSSNWKKNATELKDNRNLRNTETLSERTEESQTASVNLTASFNANNSNKLTNIVNKVISNVDSCSDGNSESKENIRHPVKQIIEDAKPLSMPAANVIYEKFSSDEDFDSPAREFSKYNCVKDKHNKKILDKCFNNNNGNKMSESSSMDDRTSGYHESSRETFRSRNNRYVENENFRSREKYDTSFRRRRHGSPDRSHQRPREYLEDRYQRPSYGKGRDIRSPDRFQNIQRKSRDHHLNYERNKPFPNQRYIHHQNRLKHKIPNDYDEPYGKRHKSDFYSRHLQEDARCYNREEESKEPAEDTLDHLQMLQSQYTSCTSPDNLQYTSCLSPDHVNTDVVLEPKEIMDTADTQLEDPRVVSKKYIIKTDDVNVTISTVLGRNVDMKLLDKTLWGIKEIAVPEALVQPPMADKLIQEIYMNIDNPVLNVTVEEEQMSEINFDSEYVPPENNKTKDVNCRSEITSKMNSDASEPHPMSNYKIPKHEGCDRDAQQSIVHDDPVKSLGLIEDFHTTSDFKSSFNRKSKTDKDSTNVTQKHDNFISKNEGGIENKIHNWLHINEHRNSGHISASKIVEGDLELSDETCDHNMELHNQNLNCHIENKTYHKQKRSDVALHSRSESRESHIVEHGNDNTPKIAIEAKNINASNSNNEHYEVGNILTKETSEDNTPDIKKINGKKQKHKEAKCKDTNIEINEESKGDSPDEIPIKDKKTKKKEKPKQIKTKFRDLFGDSSSLITPEDLGLAAISTPNEIRNPTNYLPIFEDAVDAIDIKQITKDTSQASANANQDAIPSHNSDNKEIIETNKSTKTSKESRKKKSKKASDSKAVPNELVPKVKTINENLNVEAVTKEIDVVKTVVISTGVQPQLTVGSNSEMNNETHEVADLPVQKQNEPINRETVIEALATSTPHKDLCQKIQLAPDSRIPESSCTSNDSPVPSNDNVPSAANISGTLDSQSEMDVPDLRIFVRRRKKVIKRPPMT